MNHLHAVDAFAGPGGWSLACRNLGIRETGIEFDAAAIATREAAGLVSVHADIRDVSVAQFSHSQIFIASPPCQTFSMAGNGKGRAEMDKVITAVLNLDLEATFSDERTGLILEPLRWILERGEDGRQFKWIAMEQVRECLPIWNAYADVLRRFGYSVDTGVLSTEQYGVPQTRKRAILVASLNGEAKLPKPTHSKYYNRDKAKLDDGVQPWVSMAEALGWTEDFEVLSNYNTGGEIGNKGVRTGNEPAAAVTSKVNRNKIVLRNGAQKNATVRDVNDPAPTLLGSADNGDTRWLVDGESRKITVAEAGVLQTFPADYPWQGNLGQKYQQVGNACPPKLAEAILRALLEPNED